MKKKVINQKFGEKLKSLRGKKKQYQLAPTVGCSASQWGRYEQGVVPPYDILVRIAKLFGVTVEELIAEEGGQGGDVLSDGPKHTQLRIRHTLNERLAEYVTPREGPIDETLTSSEKEAVAMALFVLRGTWEGEYEKSLTQNIKSFYRAAKKEAEEKAVNDLKMDRPIHRSGGGKKEG